jgi:hypothetical protein
MPTQFNVADYQLGIAGANQLIKNNGALETYFVPAEIVSRLLAVAGIDGVNIYVGKDSGTGAKQLIFSPCSVNAQGTHDISVNTVGAGKPCPPCPTPSPLNS